MSKYFDQLWKESKALIKSSIKKIRKSDKKYYDKHNCGDVLCNDGVERTAINILLKACLEISEMESEYAMRQIVAGFDKQNAEQETANEKIVEDINKDI